MKTSDVVMLAAIGVAGALALGSMRMKAPLSAGAPISDGGAGDWGGSSPPGFVAAHGTQTQLTDAAIRQNWADLSASLDKSQPDWWI